MAEEIIYGPGGEGERRVPPAAEAREGRYLEDRERVTAARILKRISWGAIFAGVMVALGMEILFTLFGLFIGFSMYTPSSPSIGGIKAWSVAWYLVTSFVSLYFGGWAASRLANNPETGGMHGLVTWGLTTLSTWAALVTIAWNFVGGTIAVAQTAALAAPNATQQAANAASTQATQQLPQWLTNFGYAMHSLWVFWIVAFGGVILALFASLIGGRSGVKARSVASA